MAVWLTGLSAGFFVAWSVSVIPGTKRVPDLTYLQTMQAIKRAILNPMFFLVFFGSMVLLILAAFQQFGNGWVGWLALGAALTYVVGTFGVTGLGNVPLNNEVDALLLDSLKAGDFQHWRNYYEPRWNRLHTVRTLFSVLAFLLSLASLMAYSPSLDA